jgi:hypothetical protein
MRRRLLLTVAASLLLGGNCARAGTLVLRIPKVSRPPKIEDFIKGAPREAEAQVSDFRQREPGDGVPASQETIAYFSYDEKNLYVVFVCSDDPAKVRASMAKHDSLGSDDFVGIILDTFHDHQRGYVFLANPYGVQQEGISTENQNDDYSFDTLWYTEGRLTEKGYIVWMAIPFRSLRFRNAEKQTWGLGVARMIVRNNELSFWPYMTRKISSFTAQLAHAEDLEPGSPPRNLQLIPYAVLTRARFLDQTMPGGPSFRTDTEGRVGLDAKTVLRHALTLDLTANPDFSQVESDEPQVTVNQRYEVFFPEKRPFFLENAGFFNTPETLFFSRRIADPQFGARLTGKAGNWAIGGLFADDRAPGRQLAPDDPHHGDRALNGVISVRREFSRQSSLGVLATAQEFAGSSNRVISMDGRFQFRPNWYFTGQALGAFHRGLDQGRLSGYEYSAGVGRFTRHGGFRAAYVDISPDVRIPLGFVRRVDIRHTEHFAQYNWMPERRRLVSFGPWVSSSATWDHTERLQDWSVRAGFQGEFKGQTYLSASRVEQYELFQNIGFRRHATTAYFSTGVLKWLEGSASFGTGTAINYYPARGPSAAAGANILPPFLADSTSAQAQLTIRPRAQLRLDETYLYTRLATGPAYLPGWLTGPASVFNNHVMRSKVNYQFSRRLSLRAILDYNAQLPNRLLVDQQYVKRIAADVLLTYMVNPGTALYVGYTDGYDNLMLDATAPGGLRRTLTPGTSTGRQLFVKLSYLFRF